MRTASIAALVSFALACGSSPPAKTPEPKAPEAAVVTPAAAPAPPEPTSKLRRSQIKKTIAKGLGYFLQDVALDENPVMKGEKFHGFKIKAIKGDWRVDLRSGDVVTRVNGMSIERPEDADTALHALEKAPALRVDFEREGKPQTLELPIVDDAP